MEKVVLQQQIRIAPIIGLSIICGHDIYNAGSYAVDARGYMEPERKRYGTREEVWDGEAEMTKGGLTKTDLTFNSRGKLVSVTKSAVAKKLSNLSH